MEENRNKSEISGPCGDCMNGGAMCECVHVRAPYIINFLFCHTEEHGLPVIWQTEWNGATNHWTFQWCQSLSDHTLSRWLLMCSMFVCGANMEKHKHLHAPMWIITHSFVNVDTTFREDDRGRTKRFWRSDLLPSTQLVEKKAMLRVSSGLSWVQSGDLVWGSDSPVRDELSTCTEREKTSGQCVRDRQRQRARER